MEASREAPCLHAGSKSTGLGVQGNSLCRTLPSTSLCCNSTLRYSARTFSRRATSGSTGGAAGAAAVGEASIGVSSAIASPRVLPAARLRLGSAAVPAEKQAEPPSPPPAKLRGMGFLPRPNTTNQTSHSSQAAGVHGVGFNLRAPLCGVRLAEAGIQHQVRPDGAHRRRVLRESILGALERKGRGTQTKDCREGSECFSPL